MEDSSQFSRNPERVAAILRPHNTQLSNVVVPSSGYDVANANANILAPRMSNPIVRTEMAKYYGTDFGDREANKNLSHLEGGNFKQFIHGFAHGAGSVLKTVAPFVPLIA